MVAVHSIMWPFADPPQTPVRADAELLEGGEAVYLVRRTGDGQWMFRTAEHHAAGEGNLVATTLGAIVDRHPPVADVASLDPGHDAWRPPGEQAWFTRPAPEGPTFLLRFEGVPQKGNPDYLEFGGAFINCWVRAPSLEAARSIACAEIADAGWTIIEDIEAYIIERADYTDDQREALDRFDQAQIDGEVYEFNTYPPEDLDDEDDGPGS